MAKLRDTSDRARKGHSKACVTVQGLTMSYGDSVIQRDLNFRIDPGSVFVIMGPSGCGKSTLMRHLIGLKRPAAGRVFHGDIDFWEAASEVRSRIIRGAGILYQAGALWSSMTLAENVELPLREYSSLSPEEIREVAELKLALVGLAGYGDHFPAEISGGMRKRAGLARAMALDPDILFCDEPSAGLDPISARHLDRLILELRDSLDTTVVVVTHELDSIFTVATDSIFLDPNSRTAAAHGEPRILLKESEDPVVREFLSGGKGFSRNP